MIIINSEKPSSHRPLVPPPPPAVSHFPPSTPQNESTTTSRAPSDSESEQDEALKTPEIEPSNQGAVAVDDDDDFKMDLGSDMETLKDEPAVDIKITPKPPSSRKKTTKPAESKPRAESKSSSKRSRPSSSSSSSSKSKSSSTKTKHMMANTNLKISEILQKTKWLLKLTDNVIKKFELLEEGETIVIKYWVDMPTQTGKVHLLVGMDGRKWWGNRDIAAYIDGGSLKIGVDYFVIQRDEGKLVYGSIPAAVFK